MRKIDSKNMDNQAVTNPQVSIVLTTYNGEPFIKEQVESILCQSFPSFELLIADDGSTDGTLAIANEFSRRDPRVRLLPSTRRNLGLHKNLERSFPECIAPLIAIADQDDVWDHSKLQKLVEGIGENAAIYSNSLLMDRDGQSLGCTILDRLKVSSPISGKGRGLAILLKNCVSGHAMLFKKELLAAAVPFIDERMFDQQLAFAALHSGGLGYINEPLVFHRIHDSNQTNGNLHSSVNDHDSACSRQPSDSKRDGSVLSKFKSDAITALELEVTVLGPKLRSPALGKMNAAEKALALLKRHDEIFFSVPLFVLLLGLRHELFYPGERNLVKRCFKLAKGRRYYAWRRKSI